MMPLVLTEAEEGGMNAVNVFDVLNQNNIIFISGFIDERVASDMVAIIMLKNFEKGEDDKLTIVVNSENGDIRSIFSILDMMQLVSIPIEVVIIGNLMNNSCLLLCGASKGMKTAARTAIIAPSQLANNMSSYGNLASAKDTLDIITQDNKNMMQEIAKTTGKELKTVMEDFKSQKFLTAKQAKKYGLIDRIIVEK
jgi:ATP-dependent Clp protease, protease subunit